MEQTQDVQHSPLPWEAVGFHVMHERRRLIAEVWAPVEGDDPPWDERRKANAEFIVRAVNSHDDLVAALEDLILATRLAEIGAGDIPMAREAAERALRKARGE